MPNIRNTQKTVPPRRTGFSTVEILVAVGLIALLLIVAVPRLLGVRESAHDLAAKRQMRGVAKTIDAWYAEKDTFAGLTDLTSSGCPPENTPCTRIQTMAPEILIHTNQTLPARNSPSSPPEVSIHLSSDNRTVHLASYSNTSPPNCWTMRVSTSMTVYGRTTMTDLVDARTRCLASNLGLNYQTEGDFPKVDQ